ncbi:bifunctional folylpolyglutamate synthase/dihydrofolate synthase [Aureimonas leprariae]|uniref:Dihydrofolate synthase/folylpolyglutamate synthase n=1 Tax=Plantimonas leprariae TaxID=2615207 RepID=A0A7V7PT71_9HYPH|nr:folylpolyglutamate synthase/dihydrofolate synthase family protein [Aureimonas leprariae]KAB0682899.1 bifunctional folylpolyglutamate synthase/dihydrofolate synthase [Aureimonas leprariae]
MPGLAADAIERLSLVHPRGYDLALTRIERLLDRLDNPHRRLPPVIHVAGTNGKGSTVAFVRAMLEGQGLAVHVHTSPHLVDWRERFRLGRTDGPGRLVEDAVLAEAIGRVAAANAGEPITVFEILTAAMFVLFSEHPADCCVMEVGLGGRLDATNVVERPAACAITTVSLDHQSYLGDTVAKIAGEKAGIVKHGSPVVIGRQTEGAAEEVLVRAARRSFAPVSVYGEDFLAFEEHGRMVYQDDRGLLDLPLPRLPGRHQLANAATAIATLRQAGFAPTQKSIERGLLAVDWPGRMQQIRSGPLKAAAGEGAELWLDGGHNPGAGAVIAEALADMEERVSRPLVLVVGMLNTKDPAGFFAPFAGIARRVLAVPVRNSDAGLDPEALAEAARSAGLEAETAEGVEAAIRSVADGWPEPVAPRFLVCGSLYLAGEVLGLSGLVPE